MATLAYLIVGLFGGILTIVATTWVGSTLHFGLLGAYLGSSRRLRSRTHPLGSFFLSGMDAFESSLPVVLGVSFVTALFGLVPWVVTAFTRLAGWLSALVGWPYEPVVTDLQLLTVLVTLGVSGWHLAGRRRWEAGGILGGGIALLVVIQFALDVGVWLGALLGPLFRSVVAFLHRSLLWGLAVLHLPYRGTLSEALGLTLVAVVVFSVLEVAPALRRRDGRRAGRAAAVGAGGVIALGVIVHVAEWAFPRMRPFLGWLLPLLASLAAFLGQALSSLFVLAVVVGYCWFFRHLLRGLAWRTSTYPARSFTPDRWKALLEGGDPLLQQEMLLRTNSQSVGLRATGFQELLESVEPLVKQEPALSVYWDKRDQLAEAIRQERQG